MSTTDVVSTHTSVLHTELHRGMPEGLGPEMLDANNRWDLLGSWLCALSLSLSLSCILSLLSAACFVVAAVAAVVAAAATVVAVAAFLPFVASRKKKTRSRSRARVLGPAREKARALTSGMGAGCCAAWVNTSELDPVVLT